MEVSAVLRESAATDESLLVIQMAVTEHMQLITQKYYSHFCADQIKEHFCG
jgi:DNA-binding transcriptional regulator YbjK